MARLNVPQLGIDTGGTFTDYHYVDTDGNYRSGKVPSTPEDPIESIRSILDDLDLDDSSRFVHGTTVATNALLESELADLVFVTNAGLEGILRVGRGERDRLYELSPDPTQDVYRNVPIVTVPERQHPRRENRPELTSSQAERLRNEIKDYDPEIIAVCLIHSYENSELEVAVKKALEPLEQDVILSTEVLPRYGEFERASTTVVNAGLQPIISTYVDRLQELTSSPEDIWIMGSSRGVMQPEEIVERPVLSTLSGPTAGVIAAQQFASNTTDSSIISMDMGGTSTDVSCLSGELNLRSGHTIGGYPIAQPMIDLHTVGSGGGSKLWIDEGDHLRVGPMSAGADPGPACYGNGGPATLTDAQVLLGRIPEDRALSDDLTVERDESFHAIEELGESLGMSPQEVALGAIRIGRSKLLEAIRAVTVQEGLNPGEMVMVAFGGAGGLFAANVAEELNISRVLIPRRAGVASAYGMLRAPSFTQRSVSPVQVLDDSTESIPSIDSLQDESPDWYPGETPDRFEAECRFDGQTHTLSIPVREETTQKELITKFRSEYQNTFQYEPSVERIELVHLSGFWEEPGPAIETDDSLHDRDSKIARQEVVLPDSSREVAVYDLEKIQDTIKAPAILAGSTTTVFVPANWTVKPHSSVLVELIHDEPN